MVGFVFGVVEAGEDAECHGCVSGGVWWGGVGRVGWGYVRSFWVAGGIYLVWLDG